MARSITVTSPELKTDELQFHRLTAIEELGRPFEYRLELFSDDRDFDPERVLGDRLTVRAAFKGDDIRYYNGYVTEFRHLPREGEFIWYEATLRPWLWLLNLTSDCLIFQQKTVPQILKEVFEAHGFTKSDYSENFTRKHEPRDYCVQYCESDFNFVSRLMEQEGIYYYVKHENGKHTLALTDSGNVHERVKGEYDVPFRLPDQLQGFGREHIYEWSFAQNLQTGALTLNDFDFERPKSTLEARSRSPQNHPWSDLERYDYPGKYVKSSDGDWYSRILLEARQSQRYAVEGKGDARGFTVGGLFKLNDHERNDQNREHLIVAATQELVLSVEAAAASELGPEYRCRFRAIPSDRTFRSQYLAEKPVMRGPQTAIVVGKNGEEIWTDKYGRVKVQFHWDRYGKSDESSSCWVRVAHAWAGKTWGTVNIPRIGSEVVVEFLDGDPDRPIITGMVYNADSMPPYKLPDNQTQSGVKSRTTKKGDNKTFNELRFEDKKGEEEIYFHAERDFARVVENDDSLKVGYDTKDKGNQTIDIYNDRTVTLEKGTDTLLLKAGDREVTIDKGGDTLTLKQGDQKVSLRTGKATIQAAQSIELKVGASSIKIAPAAITLKSPMIKLDGSGMIQSKAAIQQIQATGMLNASGGLVKIN